MVVASKDMLSPRYSMLFIYMSSILLMKTTLDVVWFMFCIRMSEAQDSVPSLSYEPRTAPEV